MLSYRKKDDIPAFAVFDGPLYLGDVRRFRRPHESETIWQALPGGSSEWLGGNAAPLHWHDRKSAAAALRAVAGAF